VKLEVKIDDRQLRKLAKQFPKAVDRGVYWVAQAAEREVVKTAPDESGSTISSVRTDKVGDAKYTVSVNARGDDGAPYPIFQELGTGLHAETWSGAPAPNRHRIYPRTKKFMTWTAKDGTRISRRSVAGVKPKHFMREALKTIEPRADEIFRKGMMTALQQRI